ncbi:hypothetical protein ON010_g2126 [Phytophthora cinnamomi]|nr:hypothetical protein ON010_g2126 [Phytophthora cinnamomi]
MLWNGGVEVNIYEVADSKLLVGLQKGIFAQDVMRFLDDQPIVQEYEWNGKAYAGGRYKRGHYKHPKKRASKPRRKKSAKKPGKDPKNGKHPHTQRKHSRQQSQSTDSTKANEMRTPSDEL